MTVKRCQTSSSRTSTATQSGKPRKIDLHTGDGVVVKKLSDASAHLSAAAPEKTNSELSLQEFFTQSSEELQELVTILSQTELTQAQKARWMEIEKKWHQNSAHLQIMEMLRMQLNALPQVDWQEHLKLRKNHLLNWLHSHKTSQAVISPG